MKKKFAIVFLSLFLVVSLPFAAHANIVTATGKYLITAIKHVPGGAKVNATNTATGAKHVINHGVSAPALGAAIGGGIVGSLIGGGLGLAFQAITGVALDAVDWVMDPANNQIKWKKKGDVDGGGVGSGTWRTEYGPVTRYPTAQAACAALIVHQKLDGSLISYPTTNQSGYCEISGFSQVYSGVSFKPNDIVIDPDIDADGYKSASLVDLAKKVIEQADAGQVDSQKAIEEYVTNLAKEGQLDAELDASTDITKPEGTEPEPKPDEPVKCPPGTIDVEGVCMGKSDTDDTLWCNSSDFSKKICDWIDWTQEKPDDLKPDAGKVDVIDKSKDLTINENRIDFSNQCPSPTPINTSVGGFPISTELNYQPLCDFFIMLNPFVVGMGGISSALIIAGGVRRG